ncbi:MAG: insulinase family protein, partial [Lachnospiraceae bacterium]|nr:insulinase family protein [Lachnospiraceae bacterium]
LNELKAEGIYLRHKKTKARIALISCDDDNKVFCISFRTTPENSTGVPHILEHSVLCGSDKYPIKDPFVELAKGSLNTFLNALTAPDKTMYPVASCNDKDFKNLMDVYLDSVFHPNIYKHKEIFLQEGWRYEIEDGVLKENGVVYNEMKGAYSDPSDIFFEVVKRALYPDTQYGNDSGGDPDHIPELSYEEFLEFHGKLYHPSNSYIYLYGDMDMEERLLYLDREYLSKYEYREVDSNLRSQAPAFREETDTYAVDTVEDEKDASWYAYMTATDTKDNLTLTALTILDYVLSDAPGAPVKRALVEGGIGTDMSGVTDSDMKQAYAGYLIRNAAVDAKDKFVEIVENTLKKLVKEGIDKKALLSAINIFDFRYREADFGAYPKGLMYNFNLFKTWLYDDARPFDALELGGVYAKLRELAKGDYFEKIVEEYILNNPHKAIISLHAKAGKQEEKEKALAEKLAAKYAAMSEEEKQAIIKQQEELKVYQESGDTKEDLEKLPTLTRGDIKREVEKDVIAVGEIKGVKEAKHELYTNGICNAIYAFDAKHVKEEEIPYLGLLEITLGMVDTANYKYDDLTKEINLHTGGIAALLSFDADRHNPNNFRVSFNVSGKCLKDKCEKMNELMAELIYNTEFNDPVRVKEIIAENVSRMKMALESAGHRTAINRALAGFTEDSLWSELTSGIAFYKFISDLNDNYDEKKDEILATLNGLVKKVFTKDNLIVSFTGEAAEIAALEAASGIILDKLPCGKADPELKVALKKANEAFTTSGQVQYNCMGGKFGEGIDDFKGAMVVLSTMLNYDYLWMNLRVKGGAYGCMSGFGLDGSLYLASYRDPGFKGTYDIFKGVADYAENTDLDEKTLTKYIIGTISRDDRPLSPVTKAQRCFQRYLRNLTEEDRQETRNGVLDCTNEDIRAIAPFVRRFYDNAVRVTVGNAGQVNENKELFDTVTTLA